MQRMWIDMDKFTLIDAGEIQENVFKLIGDDWMLVTGGDKDSFNTMTASWGGLGILWGKQVSFCFVRPSRYTYEFMEKSDYYTLSFFEDKYRDVLNLCGSKSGRNIDKVAETGINTAVDDTGAVYFTEAKLVLVCKKLYFQDILPENFLDAGIEKNYKGSDYHRMYVGEIIRCIKK
jgi:flavin reductase (DIM6/NTAB) family NADH-FMN oxidoreductase RutF